MRSSSSKTTFAKRLPAYSTHIHISSEATRGAPGALPLGALLVTRVPQYILLFGQKINLVDVRVDINIRRLRMLVVIVQRKAVNKHSQDHSAHTSLRPSSGRNIYLKRYERNHGRHRN